MHPSLLLSMTLYSGLLLPLLLMGFVPSPQQQLGLSVTVPSLDGRWRSLLNRWGHQALQQARTPTQLVIPAKRNIESRTVLKQAMQGQWSPWKRVIGRTTPWLTTWPGGSYSYMNSLCKCRLWNSSICVISNSWTFISEFHKCYCNILEEVAFELQFVLQALCKNLSRAELLETVNAVEQMKR